MALSSSGSSTITFWNRRSSALSFSKYFWYSSRVVAPMLRNSPRAKAGFKMLAASIAPSPLPAPTRVCISSINRIMSPFDSIISFTIAFRRSSNSPLYLAPATRAPMSSEYTCFIFKFSGTSPRTMRWASPSAIAVLPVPGSPISIGLFLVRRLKIWSTRRISSSRPITGSSLPLRALSLRLIAYLLRALYCSSADCSEALLPLRSSWIAKRNSFSVIPQSLKILDTSDFTLSSAKSIISTGTYWSPACCDSLMAVSSTSLALLDRYGSALLTLGSKASSRSRRCSTSSFDMPSFWNMNLTSESPWCKTAFAMVAGSMAWLPPRRVISTACWITSWDLIVKLLKFILFVNLLIFQLYAFIISNLCTNSVCLVVLY